MGGFEAFIFELWNTNQWVRALVVLIFFLSIAQIFLGAAKHYLRKENEKDKKTTIDIIIMKTETPISFLIILIGLKIAFSYLDYSLNLSHSIINSFMIIISIYFMIVIMGVIIDVWTHKFNTRTGRGYEDEILHLLKAIINIILIAIGLILILNELGVSITPLVASLGIISIAVGFAMQKTLGDLMGGITLVLDRCFKINDLIQLETGEVGRVVDVGLRSTRLLTLDNEMLIVPNSQMSSVKITNYAKPNNILRLRIPVDIVYGSNPVKVNNTLLKSLKKIKNVLPEPKPFVRFEELGEYALRFTLIFYIDDYNKRFTTKTDVLKSIYDNLKKSRIKIAYPTQTINMKKK